MTAADTANLSLHFLAKKAGCKLLGRCFDLKSAYRQLPISLADLDVAQVVVWNPDTGSPQVLRMLALPFGSSAAVSHFIRVSLALWTLGVTLLLLPWTSFYDDYSLVTSQEDCRSAQASTFLFFQALGWRIAQDGAKAEPFADTFRALGVVFNLQPSPTGHIALSNTPERGQEVVAWCRSVLPRRKFTPQECHVFASRIRWLEAQTHGRTGRLAVRVILHHSTLEHSRRPRPLSSELTWAIKWMICFVPQAKPRTFGGQAPRHWHVFTDGAVEGSFSGLGGVLCNHQGVPISKFGLRVPEAVLQHWHDSGTKHPVFQAELLAALVALQVWRRALTG